MTKFKSQGLYIIRIKYWNASGSGSNPSFIPTHWNIDILLHKQAKRRTIMHTTVDTFSCLCFFLYIYVFELGFCYTLPTYYFNDLIN